MRHIRLLRVFSLILGFLLLSFGCATNKIHTTNTEFALTAEAVPQGILLTFSNIPEDATHLWISVQSLGNTEEPEDMQNSISSYAGITNTSVRGWVNSTQNLDTIRETGKVIFPVVEPGRKYSISANVYNEHEFYMMRRTDDYYSSRFAYADFVAQDGLCLGRDRVRLDINDNHSFIAISSEPVFSSEVMFAEQKYGFSITILVDYERSIGVGEHHIPDGLSNDGLTWVFEPIMTDRLKTENGGWLETGSYYPAWGTAYVNIVFDDIIWAVEIAKTPEFNYSL